MLVPFADHGPFGLQIGTVEEAVEDPVTSLRRLPERPETQPDKSRLCCAKVLSRTCLGTAPMPAPAPGGSEIFSSQISGFLAGPAGGPKARVRAEVAELLKKTRELARALVFRAFARHERHAQSLRRVSPAVSPGVPKRITANKSRQQLGPVLRGAFEG